MSAPIDTERIYRDGEDLPPAPPGYILVACDAHGGCRLAREPAPDPRMPARHLKLIAQVRAKETAEREQAAIRSRLHGVRPRPRPLRARGGHGRARRPGQKRRSSTRAGPGGSDDGPGEPPGVDPPPEPAAGATP